MRLDVLTLFPEMFSGYLSQSLLKRALDQRLIDIQLHNFRDWSRDKHKSVDDRPFGGGPGMVLRPEPVVESTEAVQQMAPEPAHLILLSPQGKRLDQPLVEQLASRPRLLLLCGRYEGFDQRISDILQPEEISVGDFVLGGGEVAAMVVIDAVARLVPGVLGDDQSNRLDSFSAEVHRSGDRLLEYAQYTRPREYRGHQVPEVLLGGDHEKIAEWRDKNSLQRTQHRRGDLIQETPKKEK